jgi:hypothetical protein
MDVIGRKAGSVVPDAGFQPNTVAVGDGLETGLDDAVSRDVTVNQITWQVGTMDEVFAAADYFRDRDVEIRRVGRDMPGSNWHTYIRDPDGHTVELYYGMEQIGWDGRPRPADQRRSWPTEPAQWPEQIDALSDSLRGEVFLGPLN